MFFDTHSLYMKTVIIFMISLHGIAGRHICCCIDSHVESNASHHVSSSLLVHQFFHDHDHSSHDDDEDDCSVSCTDNHKHYDCTDGDENTLYSQRLSSDQENLDFAYALLAAPLTCGDTAPFLGDFAIKELVLPTPAPKVRLHLLFESFLI